MVASCYPWLHRVVTIRAITVNYWHSIYFIQTHILALKWFNIQRLQVDPIDFRHQSRVMPTPFMSVIGVDHIALVLLIVFLGSCRISSWGSVITFLSCCR